MTSDPRVSAMDNFTPTTHSSPGATLQSALSLRGPYAACIIGASRGVGAGVALSYAKAGATTLILAARSAQQLSAVAAQCAAINPACTVLTAPCDVSSPTSVRALAGFARAELGKQRQHLDAVVVNSGSSAHAELEVTDGNAAAAADRQWAQAFAVSGLGTYHAAHYLAPLLLEGAGRAFLAVGSIAACMRPGVVADSKGCISKMAQVRVVEHVAAQFGARGLLSVAVHPGAVETEMAVDTAPEAFKNNLVDDPELCGHFLVWLTREPGRFQWLNGRLLSANWDPDELLERKQQIIEGDLLKFDAKTE